MPVIRVFPVDAEGGDLIGNMIADDGQRAVLQPGFDQMLAAENVRHLIRQGGGAQIPVMGHETKEAVPDAAADGIGGKAGFIQPADQILDGGGKVHGRGLRVFEILNMISASII